MTSLSKPKLPPGEDFIILHINRGTLRVLSSKVRSLAIVVGWLLSVIESSLAIAIYIGFIG